MGNLGADLHLEVIEATGHTEGHMALWERNGRVLIAGDHIVGVGSAVLDAKYHTHFARTTRTHALPHTRAARAHIVNDGWLLLVRNGGDMLQYFDTTRKLIDLQPVLAIPAHGPPHYDPCALLRSYIAHRQAREDQILAAITQVRRTRHTRHTRHTAD
jgi:glyoxylase-like metal-dependent hydrolase (beta-lactamase superfamily II)